MYGLRSGSVKEIRLLSGKRGSNADSMGNCQVDREAFLLDRCRCVSADLGISAFVFQIDGVCGFLINKRKKRVCREIASAISFFSEERRSYGIRNQKFGRAGVSSASRRRFFLGKRKEGICFWKKKEKNGFRECCLFS